MIEPGLLPAEPEEPRKHNALRVIVIVLLCLIGLVAAFMTAFALVPGFRQAVLGAITALFGQRASSGFGHSLDQFINAITTGASNVGSAIVQFFSGIGTWLGGLNPAQGFDDLMVSLFGPNAPTLANLANMLPHGSLTGDPVADTMITIFVACIPIIVVLLLIIRLRDRAVKRGEKEAPRHRQRWVWVLTIVTVIAALAACCMCFFLKSPGWFAVAVILVGFTSTTFRADI